MSSNYWSSSQSKYWLVSRSYLSQTRSTDLRYCTPRQLYTLHIFFAQLIQKLGKRLLLRQIPIATACVFFRRFYLKNSICETNPYLVLAACVFVAAKVEETPVHIKSVVTEAKPVFAEHNIKMFPAEANKLGEMEFYLLEDLDFHLVIFHPYRALLHITGREPADAGKFPRTRVEEDYDFELKKKKVSAKGPTPATTPAAGVGAGAGSRTPVGQGQGQSQGYFDDLDDGETEEERIRRLMGRGTCEGIMEVDESILQISWFILNDTYRTDVHLLYPPYIIAISGIYIAFCLTTMSQANSSSTSSRTRGSSSQVHTLATSLSTNESLHLPPPPTSASEFLASFEVSLPVLFACVQDIVTLYPIWESFEPSAVRPNQMNPMAAAAAAAAGAAIAKENNGGSGGQAQKEKFGPEDAEALVRKMIEERMVDVGHPDNAGAGKNDKPTAISTGGTGTGTGATGSKKRARA